MCDIKIKNFVSNFFYKIKKLEILDIIFPPVCGICGKINENWICTNCEKRIIKYKKNIKLSKKEIKSIAEEIYYDELYYCYEYKKIIRKLLLKYKFSDKPYLCNFFSSIILKDKKSNEIFKKYDIIIPVPMEKRKQSKRGYNQTELITKIFAKKNIINSENLLQKVKSTKTQSTLNATERMENIKNAFKIIDEEKIKNKKIILFDDIYTTGSTVNEISKLLKKAGAKKILVLVIAKD